MVNYVIVGSNRFDASVAFFNELMAEMKATPVYATETSAGWGWGLGTTMFIVTRPFDQRAASVGNGSMIAFDVETPQRVDELHAKVLALGGSNEGEAGPRGEGMYAGYWRDLDGNKFNFICHHAGAAGG